jgi:hypothetical protein
MKTYKIIPFEFDDVNGYDVKCEAEISIFNNGDGSGKEWIEHDVESVYILNVTGEDGEEIELEPKSLECLEDLVTERILEYELDYDEELESYYDE